jgi:hypothetical protein
MPRGILVILVSGIAYGITVRHELVGPVLTRIIVSSFVGSKEVNVQVYQLRRPMASISISILLEIFLHAEVGGR